jgi:hypothetical protein
MEQLNKEQLVKLMSENIKQDDRTPITIHEDYWTMADLFIRQWLNNGSDGFDMVNVEHVYDILVNHKDLLISENMVSKSGLNNSGFPLWVDYNF